MRAGAGGAGEGAGAAPETTPSSHHHVEHTEWDKVRVLVANTLQTHLKKEEIYEAKQKK